MMSCKGGFVMFKEIRVLVVDDSLFMRKYISDLINSQPDMEVIDTAKDGIDAIDKIMNLKPDVITLDVEMPGKNGLEVLKAIKNKSNSQVIMFSGLTAEGCAITIEALNLGAFDFIQKPSALHYDKLEDLREELVEKIRYANSIRKKQLKRAKVDKIPTLEHLSHNTKIDAVVLGASTGGPRVLHSVITKFPADLNVPVFVVQHMPKGFTKAFAERLNANSMMEVVEAQNRDSIVPGRVYIAPGGYHMVINNGRVYLDTSPAIHAVRPAADKLLVSAAEYYKEGLLCCIFTGMGRDGADGVKVVKANGGFVIAQDEATSVIYGMPKAAYDTGCVDLVLPDYKIADSIIQIVKNS
jgi:two-component system chemotaxis response regulator CheB